MPMQFLEGMFSRSNHVLSMQDHHWDDYNKYTDLKRDGTNELWEAKEERERKWLAKFKRIKESLPLIPQDPWPEHALGQYAPTVARIVARRRIFMMSTNEWKKEMATDSEIEWKVKFLCAQFSRVNHLKAFDTEMLHSSLLRCLSNARAQGDIFEHEIPF